MRRISIVEEETCVNREKRVLLEMAEVLLKEKLITLNEKLQLTTLIRERKE